VALILAGAALFYLIRLERRRSDQIHGFFAVFSHELKTSLSRLRLRAESVQDDLQRNGRGGPALRLLEDMGKLEVQLENSLWVARGQEDLLLIETLPLSKIVGEFAHQFPLLVHLSGEAFVHGDHRALQSIFKNIFQNAVVHGEAQNIWIEVSADTSGDQLKIRFRDDGKGFDGVTQDLGLDFRRHTRSSGTGLGLYLVRTLSKMQGGDARFQSATQGFVVQLEIPGHLEKR
jgi:signal transduction histidine kinase